MVRHDCDSVFHNFIIVLYDTLFLSTLYKLSLKAVTAEKSSF